MYRLRFSIALYFIRYTIREEILPTGVLSDLSIKKLERTDSALFTCVATNAFGSDDTSINLIVQGIRPLHFLSSKNIFITQFLFDV